MGRRSLVLCAGFTALLASGCFELPRSFHQVPLERVLSVVAKGEVDVIEALDSGQVGTIMYPGARRWNPSMRPPEATARGALVVGASRDVALRAAAALARAEYDPVYVFIPETPEERRALLALADNQETTRGEDS